MFSISVWFVTDMIPPFESVFPGNRATAMPAGLTEDFKFFAV
jgi:hypothetical protein